MASGRMFVSLLAFGGDAPDPGSVVTLPNLPGEWIVDDCGFAEDPADGELCIGWFLSARPAVSE